MKDRKYSVHTGQWVITNVRGNSFVSMLPIKNQRRYLNRDENKELFQIRFSSQLVAKWLECAMTFSKICQKQLQMQLSTKWQSYMLEMTRKGKLCLEIKKRNITDLSDF